MVHLRVGIFHIRGGIRSLTIPSPLLYQLRLKFTLQHLSNIFSQNREELVAVERAARCNVKALGG